MRAKDIMTRTVVSIDQDATVLQAARLMLQHHISGLPVVDKQGALVGVLSEGDFLRRSEIHTERRRSRWLEFLMGPGRIAGDYVHSHGNKVSEVMSSDLKTVGEEASLEDIVALMEKHRIKRYRCCAPASWPASSHAPTSCMPWSVLRAPRRRGH